MNINFISVVLFYSSAVRKLSANIFIVRYRIVDENEKKEVGMPAGFREQDLVNYKIKKVVLYLLC